MSNPRKRPGLKLKAERRILALLELDPGGSYDRTELKPGEKYGLGTRRPLGTYMKLFGYDLAHGQIRGNCRWVESQQMHRDLVKYLSKDGKGIDYTRVPVEELNSQ